MKINGKKTEINYLQEFTEKNDRKRKEKNYNKISTAIIFSLGLNIVGCCIRKNLRVINFHRFTNHKTRIL